MTPESKVRNEICLWLKWKRVLCFIHDSVGIFDPIRKVYRANKNPHRRKGVGDILGVLPGGRFLSIEVKAPEVKDLFGKKIQSKGYASAEQKIFIEDVNNQGGVALIAWSVRDVEEALAKKGIAL